MRYGMRWPTGLIRTLDKPTNFQVFGIAEQRSHPDASRLVDSAKRLIFVGP
jgi:hypothetical protein